VPALTLTVPVPTASSSGAIQTHCEPELELLIERVIDHDEAAASALMDRLYPLVLKVVRAHLPRRLDEDDLTQMVFLKVFKHLGQFEGGVPLEHWVSRIAVNTCLSALKAERSRPELRWADLSEEGQAVVESLAVEVANPGESDGLAARELVQQLLVQLSPADRLVVTLLHLKEKSVAEVSALTGWTCAGVKVRAFRARKRLQKILKQLEKLYERP
jgi:RNA polymerase sigma-70 factor (ECF subfamily)